MFITVITPCMVKKNWVTGWCDITTNTVFHKTMHHVGVILPFNHLWGFQGSPSVSVCLWFVHFFLGSNKWDHCTHLTWKLGQWVMRDHYKHPLSLHCASCWDDVFSLDHTSGVSIGSPNISVSMVYAVLPGWSNCCNKWDHCTHLIC